MSFTKRSLFLIIMIFISLLSSHILAHEQGITDTEIKIGRSQVQLIYTLPNISNAQKASIGFSENILDSFSIFNNESPCKPELIKKEELTHINAIQYAFLFSCGIELDKLDIQYRFNENLEPKHINFTRINLAGAIEVIQLKATQPSHQLPVKDILKSWKKILSDADLMTETHNTSSSNTESSFATSDLISAASAYLPLGLEHILMGYDHILFLLGLILIPLTFRQLLSIITAFTLAHSITLALSALNIIVVNTAFIEAAIAATIIYVGLENVWELRKKANTPSYESPWKRRVVITFFFGLIHGFGFSFILREIGLSSKELIAPLVFFNLGVELGQLLIIATTFPLLVWLYKHAKTFTISTYSSIAVVGVGLYWLILRM